MVRDGDSRLLSTPHTKRSFELAYAARKTEQRGQLSLFNPQPQDPMSISSREPSAVATDHFMQPVYPPADLMAEILLDFLQWMRSEKGLRVCTKEGTDGGASIYEYAYRGAQKEAAEDFVAGMGMAPYRPPEPLLDPDSRISDYVSEDGDSINIDTLPF